MCISWMFDLMKPKIFLPLGKNVTFPKGLRNHRASARPAFVVKKYILSFSTEERKTISWMSKLSGI